MNLDKFSGCIMGVAIGDALGMPFEVMTGEEIRARTKGKLTRFFPPSVNPHPFPSVRNLSAGSWTDDTQLTLAVMEAIIESHGKFDMDSIAQKHVEAYLGKRRGWGRSTRDACRKLSQGVSWRDSATPGGSGNGVMMKVAPLGLRQSLQRAGEGFLLLDDYSFLRECATLGKMTHGASSAIVAGCVHAYAIYLLALHHELPAHFLMCLQRIAEIVESWLPCEQYRISQQLVNIFQLHKSGDLASETPESLGKRFGTGTKAAFSAYNSFGLAYTTFMRNPHSFDVVSETIHAGGDTDSNASIVGSLLGALHGMRITPKRLVKQLEQSVWIKERARIFFETCKNNDPTNR